MSRLTPSATFALPALAVPVLLAAIDLGAGAQAAPPGTTVRGADAARVGAAAPPPVEGSTESLTVHGQRHFVAPPTYNSDVINKFENGTYRGKAGWLNTSRYRPGSGRDANTDAAIGQFGSAYGGSSPSPGANLSAPGTMPPVQGGLNR